MFQSVVMFMGIFAILIKVRCFNKVKRKYTSLKHKSLLQRFKYHLIRVCCFEPYKGTMVAGGVSKVVEINENTGRLDMFE